MWMIIFKLMTGVTYRKRSGIREGETSRGTPVFTCTGYILFNSLYSYLISVMN